MVLLNRIYTKAGDQGRTRLVTGETVSKADPRVAAYGEVDELNAVIGLARLQVSADLDGLLGRIQNDLFDLGADLATPEVGRSTGALRIVASQVERLEREIDHLNGDLAELTSFVLPAGSAASAALHHARTVCRRAERAIAAFLGDQPEGAHAEALRFINRLSDLLFVAARWANDRGRADVLWRPGAER